MRYVAIVSFLVIGTACGPQPIDGPNEFEDPNSTADEDRDGYSPADGDCDDRDPAIHPAAPDDTCDYVDNNCNGVRDDAFDQDGDYSSTCGLYDQPDCDDRDAATYPGAPEHADGRDNDCDGIPDNHRPDYDDDGDGWTDDQGDCNDDEPLVNPGAVEVDTKPDGDGNPIPEGVDNDCDGEIDEGVPTCDTTLSRNVNDHYPQAMELCDWISSISVTPTADWRAKNILPQFGNVYTPHRGSSMVVLSSGIAEPGGDPVIGTEFTNYAQHPDPQPDPADGCGRADPSTVNDYIELSYSIQVPTNAKSMSYDFAFMSGEFPQWVCSQYDDTFLALLESSEYNGNISFDDAGRPVTINIGFFDVCSPNQGPNCTGNAELAGTGYQSYGGTGWLTTIAPVTPGETITLRFIIFDEGDRIWDSLVLIDNFRWDAEPVDGPVTIPRVEPDTPVWQAVGQYRVSAAARQ